MFIESQEKTKKVYYEKMLVTVGSLSRLFSESSSPFLHYRIAENLFCKSFGAENLSRSDTSADASLNGVGFGLKTFLKGNGRKMEKVAEFNNDSPQFRSLTPEEQVKEIIRLRNERIETTMRIYGLTEIIYHCVARTKGKMVIIETPMHLIDGDSLKIKNKTSKSVSFQDKYEEYSFNYSKSTLFKKFLIENPLAEVSVSIFEDPFEILEQLTGKRKKEAEELVFPTIKKELDHVFLPLYSTRSTGENKEVPEKSGLNQWNAGGRARSLGEVYIPIPAWIHQKFSGFFPERDTQFSLHLPDKKILTAKVCQDGSKALMTNPNEALGQWILRDILKLNEGELLTYKKLEDIGLDAVIIYKIDENNFQIDFAKVGSYDSFVEEENE